MPLKRPHFGHGFLAILALMGGCGGGDSSSNSPAVLRVTAGGLGEVLWENGAAPVAMPTNIALNTPLVFSFSGSVDPTSLPGWAGWVPGAPAPGDTPAEGSINITTTVAGATRPAVGSFAVADDPSLPAGNRRRVTFTPTAPTDPNNPGTSGGLFGNALYTLFLPSSRSGGPALRIDGVSLQASVLAQFSTCDPTGPNGASACFIDLVPGAPFVISTTPATSDPAPVPPLAPSAISGDIIRIVISEPLFPANIDLANVRLINANSGAQAAGTVVFFQAGSPEAGPRNSVIEYRAASLLLANARYEIVFGNSVTDFGGNPVQNYDPSDPTRPLSGRRFFNTSPVAFCEAEPYIETFGAVVPGNPAITVTGSGRIDVANSRFEAVFPLDTIGDGSFGEMTFPAGSTTLDTGAAPTTGFANGIWNATSFTVAAGATVRLVGTNFPAHVRCLGAANVQGTINGNAGNSSLVTLPVGSPEQGARMGRLNQGSPTNPSIVPGGVGGVGGGKGGDASQEGLNRTEVAQSGFGPAVNGAPDPGPQSANPLTYGGGAGGEGEVRQGMLIGGLGGAGGSAFAAGGNGQSLALGPGGCIPAAPPPQPIATATGIPPVFVPPISRLSGGSGGGGGGDRHNASPSADNQGGGGGGGGGGFRLTAVGDITIGGTGEIFMIGGNGAAGSEFNGGDGGGGSGGQIWLQTSGTLSISTTSFLSVAAGLANRSLRCVGHASGAGGIGLVQLESSDPSTINTNFIGAENGAHILTFPFSVNSTITAVATTGWFDTLYGDPDYLGSTAVFDLGMASCTNCSPVTVEFQGSFVDFAGEVPDLGIATPFLTAGAGGSLDALDGRRFFRVRITLAFDLPMIGPGGVLLGTTPTTPLPFIDSLQVRYATPIACP